MSTSITVTFNYAPPFNIERGFWIDIAKAIYFLHSQPLFSARLFVHVAIDNKLNLFSTFTVVVAASWGRKDRTKIRKFYSFPLCVKLEKFSQL